MPQDLDSVFVVVEVVVGTAIGLLLDPPAYQIYYSSPHQILLVAYIDRLVDIVSFFCFLVKESIYLFSQKVHWFKGRLES